MKYTNPCCTLGEGDAGKVGVLTRKQLTANEMSGLERKTNSLARAYAILIMRFLFNGHKSAACTRMNLSLPSIIRSLFSFCPSRSLIYRIAMHCRPFYKVFLQDIDIDFLLRFSRDARVWDLCDAPIEPRFKLQWLISLSKIAFFFSAASESCTLSL